MAGALAIVIAGAVLVGCTQRDDVRVADPCPGVASVSLGEPENIDRSYASFEVTRGPVWLSVTSWEPGPATGVPFTVPFFIGPMSAAPDAPDAAVALLADHVVDVVEGLHTRVDVGSGRFWVLTNSVVGEAAVVACDGAIVHDVTSAP